ncbi:MAG: hypothetical protein FWE14_09315 [Lachnospiraceae bacterium]|nr:hypothetical protein [Lachnospiraceae bacterium]
MTKNNALVTIIWQDENGTGQYALPEPTSYSGTTQTMVDAGTSVSGKLLGSVVRKDMAQISLSWNFLSAADWSSINQIFKDHYINTVCFFDQTANDWITREMYINDRSAGMWRRDPNWQGPAETGDAEHNILGWTGCNLQLMEV